MPLVGSTLVSSSSAFRSVDLPAPVLPTTTIETPGSSHVCRSDSSESSRDRLTTALAHASFFGAVSMPSRP